MRTQVVSILVILERASDGRNGGKKTSKRRKSSSSSRKTTDARGKDGKRKSRRWGNCCLESHYVPRQGMLQPKQTHTSAIGSICGDAEASDAKRAS